MIGKQFINNQWINGNGERFSSENPSTQQILWQGNGADSEQVRQAVAAAKTAFITWAQYSVAERLMYLEQFNRVLGEQKTVLAQTISDETGKPKWEAITEVDAMLGKLGISVQAYQERCQEQEDVLPAGRSRLTHKPHGVLGIIGPFNFPGHLPNGHIIPALLAGNTVVFKPSELTPLVAEKLIALWEQAKLPTGVINLIQGGRSSAVALSQHSEVQGILFTGSYATGEKITQALVAQPNKILALEMGGNNPLIVHNITNIQAGVYQTLLSAYMTSGQRCTCARRLIVTRGAQGEKFVAALQETIPKISVGIPSSLPEPFMGPVISNEAADMIIRAYDALKNNGAEVMVPLKRLDPDKPLLSPGLLEVTSLQNRADEEIFGPLLQLIWVEDFAAALQEANATEYGLSAGLLSEDEQSYHQFLISSRAGIVNWNKPLTGASGRAPFGGVGKSGNYRPSAYYAADYCAYPVASMEDTQLKLPDKLLPGIIL